MGREGNSGGSGCKGMGWQERGYTLPRQGSRFRIQTQQEALEFHFAQNEELVWHRKYRGTNTDTNEAITNVHKDGLAQR